MVCPESKHGPVHHPSTILARRCLKAKLLTLRPPNFHVCDSQNINIHVFLKRDMLKIQKKGPCQADPRCRRGIGFTKIPKTTLLHQIGFPNSHSPKILRPKILPPNCLTHYLSPFSIFPSKKIDSKGICQKIPKSPNPVLIIPYFSQKKP